MQTFQPLNIFVNISLPPFPEIKFYTPISKFSFQYYAIISFSPYRTYEESVFIYRLKLYS